MVDIAVTGCDGSGKTTLLKSLQAEFDADVIKLPRYNTSIRPVHSLAMMFDKISLLGDKSGKKKLVSMALMFSLTLYRLSDIGFNNYAKKSIS